MNYEKIEPTYTYAPWRDDLEFLKVYDKIRDLTMLDIYRCWDLWDLVGQVEKLDEGGIIELGAWKGGSAYILQERMRQLDWPLKGIIVVDRVTDRIEAPIDGLVMKASTPQELMEAFHPITDLGPLRLVHLDVNSYDATAAYDEFLWDKLVPGGIVVYDDYGCETCPGVTDYVNSQKDQIDRMVFYNLNGHGVVIKCE